MKVMFVTGRLKSPLVEGTQKSVVNLANELVSRGHEVTWLARDGRKNPGELSDEVNVIRKNYNLRNLSQFRSLAKENDVVNVHTSSTKMALFWTVIARKNSIITWAARRSRTKTDLLIQKACENTAVTKTVADWLPGNPKITPYSVDADKFSSKPGEEGNAFEVCYIGKPSTGRGFDHICKALQQLEITFSFKYGLAKTRGDLEEAKSKLNNHNLEDQTEIHYGYIEDLPHFLGSADVFANLIESTKGVTSPPILTIEAMACETVTISSKEPDFVELIEDGEEGFLIEFDDYEEIARILEELHKNEDFKNQVGERAREKVLERHSINRSADRFVEVYQDFLN